MKRVTIVGLGMGNPDTLTLGALNALRDAKQIVGAGRLLEALPDGCTGVQTAAILPAEIAAALTEFPACVVMSGDTGFYSGTKKLLPLLAGLDVTVLPGVSTVQYFAARLGRPWQDVRLVSAHGLDCDVVGAVLGGHETFFLTGGQITPSVLAERLTDAGLGDTTLHVGQRLSYPDEAVISGPAAELAGRSFDGLSAVWAEAVPPAFSVLGSGIPDEAFVRGDVPMTKREVRAAIPGLLELQAGSVVWDVGAGTGSVSVELARLDPTVQVYAVEQKPEACGLIQQNRIRFGVYNLTLVPGGAPDALSALPAPDAVFVGGSGGRLPDVLRVILSKNPAARVCVSAIAAETFAEAAGLLSRAPWTGLDIIQIAAARSRKAGPYHLMTGQNPIWLLSARGTTL